MSQKLGFLALENRYVLKGQLQPQGAMHVGSGWGDEQSDSTFVRDAKGIYIPGSSLRGVMRSWLERIMQQVDASRGCVLFAEESHPSCFTANPKLLHDFEKRYPRAAEREAALDLHLLTGGGLCDICRLFGSPLLASKLRISDCRPISALQTEVRHGVGIDRDTETAKDKIKYDFEALEKSCDFDFHLQIENALPSDFALLHMILTEMKENGIDVGGKKSRGLGRVKLKAGYTVEYFGGDYPLRRFLAGGKLNMMTAAVFETTTRRYAESYLEMPNAAPRG